MKTFKIGLDAYSIKPLGLSPMAVLGWARDQGAEGVQFSEGAAEAEDRSWLKDLAQAAAGQGLYLEWGGGQHIPFDPASGRPIDIGALNRRAAEQAAALGADTVRSCSGGLLRWAEDSIPTDRYLRAMAGALREQRPMLRGCGVILALETHFEFTSFELVRLFEMCGAAPGEFLGVCLDTMNLLTMVEDPLSATLRLLPWIVTTHVKDGGILESAEGFRTFTAEAGRGIVDLPGILEALSALPREIRLSIEDHGGDFSIPWADPRFRAKFPDVGPEEVERLRRLAERTRRRADEEGLSVLDRSRWPAACEARVGRDLAAVRAIVRTAREGRS